MKPTERIKTIKEISGILGKDDWTFIDITLRQFKLPTQDTWNGNSYDYVAAMIEDAADKDLVELAQHLEINPQPSHTSPAPTPDFWEENYYKLFLSHVSSYKKETAELQEVLNYYGITAFVAHEDIEPTKEWQSEIEVALGTMDGLAALLTPEFHESKWTDQEIGFAIGKGVPILPIRLKLDPYGFIGKYQGMQGVGKSPKQIAKEIVEILLKNKVAQPKIITGLVHSFAKSSSYAESKEKIELIEKASYIPPDLLKILQDSIKGNGQVRDSWGVPESIKDLHDKFTS